MGQKAIIGAIIKTASTFVVLVALIVGYFSYSFGWFAQNESVKGNGMMVTPPEIEVAITQITSAGGEVKMEQLAVDFNEMLPGDVVTTTITITCYKQMQNLSISLLAPTGCETPVVVSGAYYYFGSQMLVSKVKYNGQSVNSSAVGKSLMSSTPEADWGTVQQLTPSDIDLCSITPLTIGEHIIEIEFTFYNAPYSQNQLKDFGKTEGQICYREFKIA